MESMKRLLGIATLALMLAGTTQAQNLVTNGGFGMGTPGGGGFGGFAGWTAVNETAAHFNSGISFTFLDDGTYSSVVSTAHSGNYMADFGSVGAATGISQTIGTITGNTYQVSFWLANDDGCDGVKGCFTSINVSFGGVTLISDSLQHPYGWTHYTFDVVASGSSSDLTFDIQQDPNYYYLDDASVVQQAPEPASLTLLGSALGLGAGFIRRFRS